MERFAKTKMPLCRGAIRDFSGQGAREVSYIHNSIYIIYINSKIVNFSIDFILKSDRFSVQLLQELETDNNADLLLHV